VRISLEVVARFLLSAQVLLRLAILALVAFFLSQFFVAAARAAEARDNGPAGGARTITALRVWPAADYTRVTLESRQPLRHSMMQVKDPERLVLDLEEVDFASLQRELAGKVGADDPYIAAVRAGRFKPGTVRLVFDLKGEVKPQSFSLQPVAEYGHRLVLSAPQRRRRWIRPSSLTALPPGRRPGAPHSPPRAG
jgi:N-acetylmuramoyl-L-alanine amidase